MEQKIILITGASGGIGKATALALAKQGHRLILHGRNPEKTAAALEEIRRETGNEDLAMLCADLSLTAEVRRFADAVAQMTDRLDVLINNAGGQFGFEREVTAEGHEKDFAINTLAPFLLSNLLLPLLEKSRSDRIVTVSSESYRMGGRPCLDDIELEHHYSYTKAYGQSKLFAWWNTRTLAERLRQRGIANVTVNACEPGSANTGLGREVMHHPLVRLIYTLWKPMMWSVEEAAATSVYLAVSPEVEGKSGGFYGKCREKNIRKKWISASGQQAVWAYCAQVCQENLPRID